MNGLHFTISYFKLYYYMNTNLMYPGYNESFNWKCFIIAIIKKQFSVEFLPDLLS